MISINSVDLFKPRNVHSTESDAIQLHANHNWNQLNTLQIYNLLKLDLHAIFESHHIQIRKNCLFLQCKHVMRPHTIVLNCRSRVCNLKKKYGDELKTL